MYLKKYLLLILVSCVCIMGGGCAGDAEDANTVVVYCSVDQQIAEPILKAFETKHGIRVQARYDTEASKTVGLVQRLRAEKTRPLADVFWSSEVFYTIQLAQENCFTPFEPNHVLTWPQPFADRQGLWYGFAVRHRMIAYHSERVTAAEAPRSLESLLDPKWKGRLVMARPEFGTTGGDVTSWFTHYGPERAKEILQGLKANQIRLVDGNSTAVRMVATGQADICMTDTDDVYAAQRNAWLVAMFPLDQQGKGALAIPNTAALIKGAPHLQTAKILMAYLLSEDVERRLAQSDSRNTPIRSQLQEALGLSQVPPSLNIDYTQIANQLDQALKIAREVLP